MVLEHVLHIRSSLKNNCNKSLQNLIMANNTIKTRNGKAAEGGKITISETGKGQVGYLGLLHLEASRQSHWPQ